MYEFLWSDFVSTSTTVSAVSKLDLLASFIFNVKPSTPAEMTTIVSPSEVLNYL